MKSMYVYMMTNQHNTTLYTGVTNDLVRRVYEHKNKMHKGFTSRYNLNKLVYYEIYDDEITAIQREKVLNGGSRERKNELVNSMNPDWKDLYDLIC
ncbi:MAG: GIY-YIG nuclease family protein [Alphaproteobacteria bacterium]|nr:GIY-YIG nuclease family protein [Alphaproteobacteria bacterium]